MSNRDPSSDGRPVARRRWLRWLVGLGTLAVFLAAYALVVLNVSGQIGDRIEGDLRSLPVLEDHHHRAAPRP
ncbi:hypothetical protein [Luteimonas abyssi]|uniref:hypothetical protein n=1 Tax=Luteimonas abyssi TaxID=1247514 RepID=UPI000737C5E0|nr:hypothetical protein [Luteimonas abyssi]